MEPSDITASSSGAGGGLPRTGLSPPVSGGHLPFVYDAPGILHRCPSILADITHIPLVYGRRAIPVRAVLPGTPIAQCHRGLGLVVATVNVGLILLLALLALPHVRLEYLSYVTCRSSVRRPPTRQVCDCSSVLCSSSTIRTSRWLTRLAVLRRDPSARAPLWEAAPP
jgi:hypothetical protein